MFIRIQDDKVRVHVTSDPSNVRVNLTGYDPGKHQTDLFQGLFQGRYVDYFIQTLHCINMIDHQTIDEIIRFTSMTTSISKIYLVNISMKPDQLLRILTILAPKRNTILELDHISFTEVGVDVATPIKYELISRLNIINCQPDVLNFTLRAIQPSQIIFLELRTSTLDPGIATRFIASCTKIDLITLQSNSVDSCDLFDSLPDTVHIRSVKFIFDWFKVDTRTAIRFIDILYGLYRSNQVYEVNNKFVHYYEGEITLERVLERLKVLAVRTFNRMDSSRYFRLSIPIVYVQPFKQERDRLQELPYEQIMIMLVARRRRVGPVKWLSNDIFSKLTEMFGM